MKLAAMLGSSTGVIGTVAIGAVVAVVGAVGFTVFTAEDPPAPIAEIISEPVVDVAAIAPDAVDPVTPEPTYDAPLLDLVRVAPDGSTVIAGQTSPDMAVAILLDGVEVDLVRSDGMGAFVALLSLLPSDTPRAISAEARPEGAEVLAGLETILIAPFAAPEPLVAEAEAIAAVAAVDPPEGLTAAPATAEPTIAPTAPLIASVEPAALSAPALTQTPNAPSLTADANPAMPQPAGAAAPAVVIAGPEGLRVVQGPALEPAVQTGVRLDAISYNAQGAVILAGRGPVAADIQVFINNQPIQLGEIGPGGDWSLQLPNVDPGTYTLAVAEIAPDGSTASRVETPFLREDPVRVVQAPAQTGAGINVITVQPGFTLWGMAQETFGDGILYVQIFEENRDQIRDPDWIFPGQIFRMPALGADAETAIAFE